MATDHLLPFHLYFRRRENVIALHILASISKGKGLFLCKSTVNRLCVVRFAAFHLANIVQFCFLRHVIAVPHIITRAAFLQD